MGSNLCLYVVCSVVNRIVVLLFVDCVALGVGIGLGLVGVGVGVGVHGTRGCVRVGIGVHVVDAGQDYVYRDLSFGLRLVPMIVVIYPLPHYPHSTEDQRWVTHS